MYMLYVGVCRPSPTPSNATISIPTCLHFVLFSFRFHILFWRDSPAHALRRRSVSPICGDVLMFAIILPIDRYGRQEAM